MQVDREHTGKGQALPQGAPPKLLYVSTLDHIIRPLLPQIDGARAAGFQVEVACCFTRFRDEIAAHADALHHIPARRFPLHPANVPATARLVRLMRENRYLIVHAHNPTGGFVGRLAATLARVPVRMYTAHGFHFHPEGGRLTNAAYRAIETFAGRFLSDGVIVVNREDERAARAKRVVPDARLFLAGGGGICTARFDPGAVSAEERQAVRRELDLPDEAQGAPVLAIVGEMIPRKRHADALRAVARVAEQHPDVILLLCGDGVLQPELQDLARSLGIDRNCRFPGFRPDVERILAVTDLFLFPSGQEGLPFCVQEALSMEVPVVASEVRGNSDLIDNDCGRLVPPGDPDALATAVLELLDLDPAQRRRMAAEGRARMVRERDEAVAVAQWLDVYATLLQRKQLPAPAKLHEMVARGAGSDVAA